MTCWWETAEAPPRVCGVLGRIALSGGFPRHRSRARFVALAGRFASLGLRRACRSRCAFRPSLRLFLLVGCRLPQRLALGSQAPAEFARFRTSCEIMLERGRREMLRG